MNFLRQVFRKLLSNRQTDIRDRQTDRINQNYEPCHFTNSQPESTKEWLIVGITVFAMY